MRLLFLGDVIGRSGRQAVLDALPILHKRLQPEFVIVNGENAAGGFGITEKIFHSFLGAGVSCVTLGNHAFSQQETRFFIDKTDRLIRPINYAQGTPGKGAVVLTTDQGRRVLVINVLGTAKMEPLENPFHALDQAFKACPLGDGCDAVVVDIHAELTSEKMAIGHFCDGRASLVVGTHTHVPTADHQILPQGTAYMTDCGMCGDYYSVIGMQKEEPLNRFLGKTLRKHFTPALGAATICGVFIEIDPQTGRSVNISPIRVGGRLEPIWPSF